MAIHPSHPQMGLYIHVLRYSAKYSVCTTIEDGRGACLESLGKVLSPNYSSSLKLLEDLLEHHL